MCGRYPRFEACRAIEYAPEMTAWEAMRVARVAMITSGTVRLAGTSMKNGLSRAFGFSIRRAPWPR